MAVRSPQEAGETPAPKPRRRWAWWQRLLAGLGVLLLLIVVFYQPIIVLAVKLLAPGLAAKQGLKINNFKLGGTIFTSLRVEDLHARPTRPGPFEKVDVGHLELHYNLLTLARHGLNSDFITSAELHDTEFIYDPSKSPPAPPKKKEPFSLPPLPLPGRLSLRHVTFLMRPDTPEGARATGQAAAASSVVPAPVAPAVAGAAGAVAGQGLLVADANLELDPARTGDLAIAELRIPGGPDLTNISAKTSYRNRNLQLTDAALAPDIHFKRLGIDGSKLDQQRLAVTLDADLFKGHLGAAIHTKGIGVPPDASVQLDAGGLSLESLRDFLKTDAPFSGTVDNLAVRFDGNTNQPKSWAGRVELRVAQPAFGGTALDAAGLKASFKDGAVTLEEGGAQQGGNRVAGSAKIQLAERMADLPRSDGHGSIQIDAPDFSQLPVKLPLEITGALHANSDFTLAGGKVSNTLKGHIQALNIPVQRVSVAGVDFAVDLTKAIPADATTPPTGPNAPPPPHLPFYDKLQTRVAVEAAAVRYADYAVDGVKLNLSSDEANLKLDGLEITRGPDVVNADGTWRLPEDFAQWQQSPLDARLSVALPDVAALAAEPGGPALPLQGKLDLKASVQGQGGVYNGGLDLQARDLKAKGATVQSADLQVAVANNEATVKTGHIVYDDKNSVDLRGHGTLSAPYPFDAGVAVNLGDLSRFNPVLLANGVDQPLAGSVKLNGHAGGHLATAPGANDQAVDGSATLAARDLEAKNIRVQSVDARVDVAGNRATVKEGQINFDPKTFLTFSGASDLAAPYNYEAQVKGEVPDLGVFKGLLQAPDAKEKVAGAVHLVGQVKGRTASQQDAGDQKLDGSLQLQARSVEAKGLKVQSADVDAVVADNHATIKTGRVQFDAKTGLTFGGGADLAAPYNYQGSVAVDVPDLGVFAPLLQTPGKPAEKVAGSLHLKGEAKGHLDTKPGANDQEVTGTLNIAGRDLQAKGATIQRIDGQIAAANEQAIIQTFQVRVNDKNTVDITGQAGTKAPYAYKVGLNINLQDLGVFQPFLKVQQQAAVNPVSVDRAKIEAAASATTPTPNEVNGPKSSPVKGPKNLVTKTNTRSGPVEVTVKGAPTSPGKAEYTKPTGGETDAAAAAKLAGSLAVQWQAQGDFAKTEGGPHYSGGGSIAAHKVEFNAVGPLEADIQGKYSQQVINFPVFFVGSNGLEFRCTIGLKDALARVDNIHLKEGPTELLAGYAQVPLDLTKLSAPGGPVPDVDKIDVNIASKPLALETLFGSLDKTKKAAPPAQGTVQLQVDAHGSLSKIVADVKVGARQIRSPQTPTLRPLDADVDLTLHNDRLDLNTSVRQPQIQPLTIKGNVPVDLRALAQSKALDPKSPVQLNIQLPRSSLGFLAGVTKAIRHIEGDAAADVRVGGTLEKPTFAGSAELNVIAARADNITIPAVRDFHARLGFADRVLRIERFSGEIGGGTVGLDGSAAFTTLSEATLNLAARAKDVLAVRDDNITVRVNADVKVTGPLSAANVTGSLGLTKSRYLKDIDILPLNTPGKPAPATPAPSSQSSAPATIGVYTPPVSNWKFDIAIRTDDPFQVRGNLANGTANADLHLRGTGAKPLLDGNVNIKNLVATLPFSRLEITDGNVNFTPDQPLNPVLNINGTSNIRTYLVTVFVTGRANNPKVTFSSDPPLAQEQIVSLLATGATTEELAGSAQSLAGKATLLLVQDLYRRTFKKRSSARAESKGPGLGDRVDVNLGDVDPQTGQQQVAVGYKITDQVGFVGDLGIGGSIRGRVRYVLRFR